MNVHFQIHIAGLFSKSQDQFKNGI